MSLSNIKKRLQSGGVCFNLLILLGCGLLIACSQDKSIEKVTYLDDMQKIRVSLIKANNLSESQQRKYHQATNLMEYFLNHKDFKTLVYKGPKSLNYISPNEAQTNACNKLGRATFTYNTVKGRCFNNKEIYRVIKSANWQLKVAIKPSLNLTNCKSFWSNTVGALEGETIVTPKCTFDTMSVEFLAGFLIHEYLHVIGFRHPYQPSTHRKNTIPYFIGDAALAEFYSVRE